MKRLISLLLLAAIVISLAACGMPVELRPGSGGKNGNDSESTASDSGNGKTGSKGGAKNDTKSGGETDREHEHEWSEWVVTIFSPLRISSRILLL